MKDSVSSSSVERKLAQSSSPDGFNGKTPKVRYEDYQGEGDHQSSTDQDVKKILEKKPQTKEVKDDKDLGSGSHVQRKRKHTKKAKKHIKKANKHHHKKQQQQETSGNMDLDLDLDGNT